MKDTTPTSEYTGVHEEFVRVIQGTSSLYRFGSDRIYNAELYCRKHAQAMTFFRLTRVASRQLQVMAQFCASCF